MKKFVMGLIIGAGLAFSASVYADEITSYIGMPIEGQFPVTVNGVQLDEPGLVVNDITYLPVRKIGEMFNAVVSFSADLVVEVTTVTEEVYEQPAPPEEEDPVETEVPVPDPVEPEVSREDLIKRIERIDGRVRTMNLQIELNQRIVDSPNTSQRDKDLSIEGIGKLQANIAELEAEKAELEAQLEDLE